jgi:hypothetical protein
VDVAKPWAAVTSPLVGAVLAVLVGTTQPISGREVHRLAGCGSQEGVRKALQRLVREGVVQTTEMRGTTLFSLNRAHLAVPALDVLTSMRGELMRRIREQVASWSLPPIHLSMFGSAARGDGGPDSDIDLFLVRRDDVDPLDPVWDRQIGDLREAVHDWTGNHAAFLEQSQEELRLLRASASPLLDEWRRDAIHLYGLEVREIA